jgi:hypothetical protein
MKITVNRFTSDDDSTISAIYIDGKFECFGLEDEHRDHKVPGETRIPPNTYKVRVRDVGGFHGRYLKRFPDFHRGMLEVVGVPFFKYVLIHIGNTEQDTAACLLVGLGCYTKKNDMSIQSSVAAYKRLYNKVIDAAESGILTIEYIDND